MKRFHTALLLVAFSGSGALAQAVVLSGTLSADRSLHADSCYNMQDCFVVPNGRTLTIPAGTEIRCDAGSNLVVERGSTIIANGTAMAPVVFTSRKSNDNRTPGDWGGIALFGAAPNNESLNATRDVCVARSFGGTTVSDNSGTLQYVRIEYAGSSTNKTLHSALLFASVGDATNINHIQVSESIADGFCFTAVPLKQPIYLALIPIRLISVLD